MRRFITLRIAVGVFFVIAFIVAAYFLMADRATAPVEGGEEVSGLSGQSISVIN